MIRDRRDRSDDKGDQGQTAADRQDDKPERVRLLDRQARKVEQALRAAREPQD